MSTNVVNVRATQTRQVIFFWNTYNPIGWLKVIACLAVFCRIELCWVGAREPKRKGSILFECCMLGTFFSCYAIWPLAQLWVIEFTPLLGWGWGWQRFNHTLHSHAERQLKVRSTVLPTTLISFFAVIKHSDQTQHKGRKGIIQLKIPCHSPSLKEAVYSTRYCLPPRNSLYSQRNAAGIMKGVAS